jgi:lysophospholipase L1-like esterase
MSRVFATAYVVAVLTLVLLSFDVVVLKTPSEVLNVENDFSSNGLQTETFIESETTLKNALTGELTQVTEPPKFLLLGDSFSNAYSLMFDELHNLSTIPTFVRSSGRCAFLINGYGPESCVLENEKLQRFILKNRPKKVFIANNWNDLFNGKIYTLPIYHKETNQSFRLAIEQTVKFLRTNKIDIAFLLSPPMGSSPESCVTRYLQIFRQVKCNLSKVTEYNNHGHYREFLSGLASRNSIPVFDPHKYLCDAEECIVMKAGRLFTTDGNHLSPHGAKFLARVAKDQLLGLVR